MIDLQFNVVSMDYKECNFLMSCLSAFTAGIIDHVEDY